MLAIVLFLRGICKQLTVEILFRVDPKKIGRPVGQGTGGKD